MTDDLDKQRLTTLARRLAAATAAGSAQWLPADDDAYAWGSTEGSVTVASRDRDNEPPYELAVYNPRQEKVDELTSELLDDDEPAPWNDALVELYQAARRSALRADDIIDALIDALPVAEGSDQGERSFLSRALKGTTASASDTN
jgi:hypothetical protein